jgi:hypothetical protein
MTAYQFTKTELAHLKFKLMRERGYSSLEANEHLENLVKEVNKSHSLSKSTKKKKDLSLQASNQSKNLSNLPLPTKILHKSKSISKSSRKGKHKGPGGDL